MGGQISSSSSEGARSSRRGRRRPKVMSEINVTPFVDVMLVLLIVFMVTAPLLTVGVAVDLPETSANPLEGDTEPITVSIKQDGKIFLQETEILVEDVVDKLLAIAENGYDERIYVRGDKDVEYGTIIRVMAVINKAGFKRIGLVTIEEQGS